MRAQSQNFRRAMGVLLAGAAFAIIFNVSQSLQTAINGLRPPGAAPAAAPAPALTPAPAAPAPK